MNRRADIATTNRIVRAISWRLVFWGMRPWLVFLLAFFVSRVLLAAIADWPRAQTYLHPINTLEGVLLAPIPHEAGFLRIAGRIVCAVVLYVSFVEGVRRVWHGSRVVAGCILVIPLLKSLVGVYFVLADAGLLLRFLHYDLLFDLRSTYFLVGGTRPVVFTYRDLLLLFSSIAVFPLVIGGMFAAQMLADATVGLSLIPRQRPCPRCGTKVGRKAEYCRGCGVVFSELGPWER